MFDAMGGLNFYAYCSAWAQTYEYEELYGRNFDHEKIAFSNACRLGIVFW